MNEYGLSPLAMLQMVGPMMFVVPMLLWLVVIGPLLVYPLARWKMNREGAPDSHLGIKVALHYFRMLGFQLLLLGTVILLWTIFSKGGGKGDMYRAAFGFLVPGAIVFGAHAAFLPKTNDVFLPGVRRLFMGYNLLVTGLLGFVALVLACQALFAKGSSGNEGRLFFAGLLVYGGAWVACGISFARVVFGDTSFAAPGTYAPPPPPPPPAPPAGPSLPSLSAGSFPPIEPKT